MCILSYICCIFTFTYKGNKIKLKSFELKEELGISFFTC